jgi:hypothetical protein
LGEVGEVGVLGVLGEVGKLGEVGVLAAPSGRVSAPPRSLVVVTWRWLSLRAG